MTYVIAGPTLANVEKLTREELERHARSLEEYGWRVCGALDAQARINHELLDELNGLLDKHAAGDAKALLAQIEKLARNRAKHRTQQGATRH